MLIQDIIDRSMCFLNICTGWHRPLNDTHLLINSSFYRYMKEVKYQVDISLDMREYIIGGGYPLLPWLIILFLDYDNAQTLLNFKLCSTQIVVE
eukprot:Gb_33441 [translate_table: standard]